ncbi:MAG: tetratricopeptide repeat protein [Nitrospirota bacterium]
MIIAYTNSLHGEFHLDDLTFRDDPALQLRDLSPSAVGQTLWHRRPVASLTFALNYYWGESRVIGYHLVNVAIHAAAGLALYAFVFVALGLSRTRDAAGGLRGPVALGAALLWAVHPVQTQAVAYVVQRMTSLAALFYVLALTAYLKGRLTAGWSRARWWIAGLVAGALALGSKEIAATLPVAVVLAEICFFGPPDRRTGLAMLRWLAVLSVPVAAVAVLAARGDVTGSFWTQLTAHRSNIQLFTFREHLLTEGRVIAHYLTLLVWPHPSRLNFDYLFSISRDWLDPPATLAAWLGILGGIGWAVSRIRRFPLPAFGVLWFFLNLAIESSLIPLDLVFEHRLYLPSMGLALLLALAGARLWRRHGPERYLPVLVGALLTLLWTGWTIERNRVWATEFSLWSDTVAKAPRNPRALTRLGVAYNDRGDADHAYAAWKAATDANPDFHDAQGNLGSAMLARGDLHGALAAFQRARALKPTDAQDAYHLGLTYQRLGRLDEARREYQDAIRLDPDDAESHNNLGAVHQQQGRDHDAIAEFQRAIALDPRLPQATYGMGQTLQRLGRIDEAMAAYQTTIQHNPEHVDAHIALAKLSLDRGEQAAAITLFEAALRLAPNVPEGHYQVARLLDAVGRRAEALNHYRRFLDLATPAQAAARSWVQQRAREIAATE